MQRYKILLIDDDDELAELLTDYMESEGFEIHCCSDGLSGLEHAYDESIDLILLDVMMPELNGFEVLKALGGRHNKPIIMLTAKGDETDRILGLELGADDYLAKPFNHKELIARIKATLRRIELTQTVPTIEHLTVNQVTINHSKREVHCHQQLVELTGTEYQLLTELMNHSGEIVSKDSLCESVLGRRLSPFDRSIDMHVSNIRRKLHQTCQQEKIKTIRSAGYIFLTGET